MKIVGIGASVCRGGHNSAGHDLVTTIAGVLGMTPINKGVDGNTSAQMLARFSTDVVALAPDAVFLSGDGIINDIFYGGVTPAQSQANYDAMIAAAKAASIPKIGIMTPNIATDSTWTKVGPYNQAIRYLASKYDVTLWDWYYWFEDLYWLAPSTFISSYMVDSWHPNDVGIATAGSMVALPQNAL